MKRILTVVAAVALLVPSGLAGQGRVPARGGFRMDGPPQLGAGPLVTHGLGFGPTHLLARRQALDLTDDQIERLETLEREVRSAEDATRSALREHGDELREAWRADDVDADAVRTHARALLEARQTMELARLEAALEARNVLDDGQRGRVEGWMAGRMTGARGFRRAPHRREPPRRGGRR